MDLIVEGVSHRYGAVAALEAIDLGVRAGEILALIGPSGCGKSTLLGIMGGILAPSAGRVLLAGAPPPGSLNPLTYIFQDFALLPWRTVAGNVALALEHHPLAPQERAARVADVLARTGLTEFRAAFPKQLSGGMRQRVGIARALAVKPAVLLMDEPLSALDAQTRDLLMEDFLALWLRERTTAVYVTHNLAEALRLADRVAILSRRPGRLRDIVPIAIPQAERGRAAAQAELAALHERLWGLIKAERSKRNVRSSMATQAERDTRALKFRGGGFVAVPRRGVALVVFVGLIALWELAVRQRWISSLFLPAPSAVVDAFRELIASGMLWRHVSVSLVRIAGGWLVGTAAGFAIGFAMGIWSLARAVGLPLVSALFPIPKIALLPLLILWLGIGETSKIATIALGVTFPTIIAVYSAIDAVPRNLIRMAQSFNLPWPAILRKIVLPGALPGILAGFRITASIALILLVSAEMIGAEYGIGAFILTAGNLMLTDQLLAGVVCLSVLGLAIGAILTRLERWLLRWR